MSSVRSVAVLLVAALIGAASLSGAATPRAEPIPIEIPTPFGEVSRFEPARTLAPGTPDWARRLYARSLLVVHSLADPRTGAVIAGAREGWDYVWPRDAAAVSLALAAAGERRQARKIAEFLLSLDLEAAGRFEIDGDPVPGRPAAGDGAGWVAAAAMASGLLAPNRLDWRRRQDYGESIEGDLLGNAIAAGVAPAEIRDRFTSARGLTREAGGEALDTAAAWAIVPFEIGGLREPARRTLLNLAGSASRFGTGPTEDWTGGEAWTAPTAWTAWALARLEEPDAADDLLAALRRSLTSAGTLPERVSTGDGRPLSVTPLAWSHAFAILALLERYPPGADP